MSETLHVLVLNASYEVLNITKWQRALCLVFTGKAEALESSDMKVRSATMAMVVPSVIRMNYHVKKPRLLVPFSRANLFLRDRYTCQYCGENMPSYELTLDHVRPRSLGGETNWENVVTACRRCNTRKGDRFPDEAGMDLKKRPRAPYFIPTLNCNFRDEWGKYIPYAVPALQEARH